MAQRVKNTTNIHEDAGSIPGLALRHCCELWCRLAEAALIRPLAWEPPYATCAPPPKKNLVWMKNNTSSLGDVFSWKEIGALYFKEEVEYLGGTVEPVLG